jgi:tetratricopeptide (TPR) repeat protein
MLLRNFQGILIAAVVLTISAGDSLGATRTTAAAPRPISATERIAVAAAADYLDRGAAAFHERLAAGSPLRSLDAGEVLREIEVRAGPHVGAQWALEAVVPSLADSVAVFSVSFPSGLEDVLTLHFVDEGGETKLATIQTLADRSTHRLDIEHRRMAEEPDSPQESRGTPWPELLTLAGAAFALTGVALRKPSRATGRSLVGVAALLFAGALAATLATAVPAGGGGRGGAGEGGRSADAVRLAPLLETRRALTTGGVSLPPLPPGLTERARTVARLWSAQDALRQMKVEEVEATLASFPSPSDIPLVEILRGRVAAFRSREVDAVIAWERAIDLGPGRDGLFIEIAASLANLGFEDRAKRYFERLERLGSREPMAYYTLAMLQAFGNEPEAAAGHLRRAWSLSPVERAWLVEAGPFFQLLRDPEVAKMVDLSSAAEPVVISPALSSDPVDLPDRAVARVCGELMVVEIGESELVVPSGAKLAPYGSRVVDAGTWQELEDAKALGEMDELRKIARTAGAFASPAVAGRLLRAAQALARHNRWHEVVELTESFSPRDESVALDVLFVRAEALNRVRRQDDSRRLLAAMAVSPVVRRKSDPGISFRIGQMMASLDMFDASVKMMQRASAGGTNEWVEQAITRVVTNKRLAHSYAVHETRNFEVRYPREVDVNQAKRIGEILEAELERVGSTIPVETFERVTVNVLGWNEFRSSYTGSDYILGFYDGKITVPIADVGWFIPEIVALITHELAHAMIAQATGDNAPHWFHEGLAQRVMSVRYHANALNMYDEDKLISLALLDAVIRSSPDPDMIEEAYIESQTVIRFLEANYPGSIQKLLAEFRRGSTTSEAIRAVTGSSMGEFDLAFRAWGRGEARVFVNERLVRYDVREEGSMRFSRAGAEVQSGLAAPAQRRRW